MLENADNMKSGDCPCDDEDSGTESEDSVNDMELSSLGTPSEPSLPTDRFLIKKAPRTIRYVPNFITAEEEAYYMRKISNAPAPKWSRLSNRRVLNYGGIVGQHKLIQDNDMPRWLISAIDKIARVPDAFPAENRPNHVLINEYQPGQGILAHTDGPAYYKLVSTISLGGDALLDYYKPVNPEKVESKKKRYAGSMFLERCSLLLVSDDAYELYLHEIAERSKDVITKRVFNLDTAGRQVGEVIERKLRVSMTIRNVPAVSSALRFFRKT